MEYATLKAANGLWETIYKSCGITYSPKKHVECPLCNNKSFRTDDKTGNGDWICVCGAGTGVKLLQQHLCMDFVEALKYDWICVCGAGTGVKLLQQHLCMDFVEALKYINDVIGFKYEKQVTLDNVLPVKVTETKNKYREMWENGQSLAGTIGEEYLKLRRIYEKPRGVRFVTDVLYDFDQNIRLPAIMSIMTSPDDMVRAHMTFLNPDGTKYDGWPSKKMYNIWDSDYIHPASAVKLFPHDGVLGISEGLENSCSVKTMYHVPTWSVCNANLMEGFRAPKGVHTLYIFADNDCHGRGIL